MVIGAGSLSYQLMKSLTDRLPVMICPRWLTTATQPIAVDDVLAYLLAAKDLPPGESRIFEIGCEDVTTYGGMVREYARQKGLRRWLIFVPVLTPYLSSLWLALVTPAKFGVGRHLIEGLKNPTMRKVRGFLLTPICGQICGQIRSQYREKFARRREKTPGKAMSHPIPKGVRRVRLSYPALLNLSSISADYPSDCWQNRDIIRCAPTDGSPQSRLPASCP